ncbi:DUF1549 domain-containing protein [soil metagenome]
MSSRSLIGFGLMTAWLLSAGCGRSDPPPRTAQAEPPGGPSVVDPRPAPVEPTDPIPETPLPAVEISPARAELLPGDPGLQLIVNGTGSRGGQRDRTAIARWEVEPAGVVAVDPGGYVRPIGSGLARIRAILEEEDEGESEAVAEVRVLALDDRPWDFDGDIVPIFTRAGCNAGGCHGKADGQNGFHLSLFGYDPEGDYQSLTREYSGRRLSTIDPESSLLLRKATGRTAHKGGRPIAPGSTEHRTLSAWIAAGAARESGQTHGKVAEVTVEPGDVRLDEPGPQQLRVVARYEDGHERDVTRLATYSVNDDSAANVDGQGRAVLHKRAETDLVVRYQTQVVTRRIGTLIHPDLDFDFDALSRRNFIDEELFRRLESLKVPPSPTARDTEFLRRVTLDLTGQIPRPDQIRAYLEDDDPEKRFKLVDELMRDPLFNSFWQIKLGDLLQISRERFAGGWGPYDYWLRSRFSQNRPWDEMVRELLTSLGNPNDLREGGPVNYALDGEDARAQAELTAQRFLGQRFRCAQCHDHPFDIWTQDDYYGLAAFFAKVRRPGAGPGGMMAANRVTIDPDGSIEHLRTRQPASPRLPGGEAVEVSPEEDPRQALAAWLTAPDNPYFARASANWAWAQFFGKGLADPADDLSASNPPVHPELLDALARDFIEHGYDLRHLIRTIATSEAYALSSAPVPGNEQDRRLFSHQIPRPLTAHQMADALAQATNTPLVFDRSRGGGGGTAGSSTVVQRAVEVNDPSIPNALLDTFGRCPRTNGCSAVATPLLSLRQSLLLIGGSLLDDRIGRFDGYLASLLEFDPEPEEIVENLYLRTLCRKPLEEERSHWTAELKAAPSLREASEDLFWALLNSREFAFNH